jgi:hypothetical protein
MASLAWSQGKGARNAGETGIGSGTLQPGGRPAFSDPRGTGLDV